MIFLRWPVLLFQKCQHNKSFTCVFPRNEKRKQPISTGPVDEVEIESVALCFLVKEHPEYLSGEGIIRAIEIQSLTAPQLTDKEIEQFFNENS